MMAVRVLTVCILLTCSVTVLLLSATVTRWGLQRMTTSYTTYYLPISYSESHIAILGQEQERNKGLGLSPEGLNGYIAAISYSGDTQNIRYLSIGY